MFLDDNGQAILTIDEIQRMVEEDRVELISIGYMQADCNESGAVDFGDALRILEEQRFGLVPVYRHVQSVRYHPDSIALYITLLRIYARTQWKAEFPHGEARDKVYARSLGYK